MKTEAMYTRVPPNIIAAVREIATMSELSMASVTGALLAAGLGQEHRDALSVKAALRAWKQRQA